MRDELRKAFDSVHASRELKERTLERIRAYQEERKPRPVPGRRRGLAAAAACLVLALAGWGGYWLYFTPTVAISIDVNPSLELGVNRFDRVVSVEGYNEDGQALAAQLSVTHLPYEQAVEQILDTQEIAALLAQKEIMTITVTGSDEGQCGRILSCVEAETAQSPNIHCQSARREEVEAAHDLGLSYGKYRAYLEVLALDPTVTPEEIQGMTMREIREMIQALSSGQQPSQSGGQGQNQGHGSGNSQGNGNGHGNGNGNGQGGGHGSGPGWGGRE